MSRQACRAGVGEPGASGLSRAEGGTLTGPGAQAGARAVRFPRDSYWVMEGLLLSEMPGTVKGMLQNFLDLVRM